MKQNREYHPLLDEYIHDFYYLLSLYFNNFLKLSGYKRFLVFTLILNFLLYLIFFDFTHAPSVQSFSTNDRHTSCAVYYNALLRKTLHFSSSYLFYILQIYFNIFHSLGLDLFNLTVSIRHKFDVKEVFYL